MMRSQTYRLYHFELCLPPPPSFCNFLCFAVPPCASLNSTTVIINSFFLKICDACILVGLVEDDHPKMLQVFIDKDIQARAYIFLWAKSFSKYCIPTKRKMIDFLALESARNILEGTKENFTTVVSFQYIHCLLSLTSFFTYIHCLLSLTSFFTRQIN